jgi:hypothetical protein
MFLAADVELLIVLQAFFSAAFRHEFLKLIQMSRIDITRLARILMSH